MIRIFDKQARLEARLARVSLIACDLDGTLLTSENTVTQEVLDAISALYECGVDIIIASGRSQAFTEHYAEIIGSSMPVIALNGGITSAYAPDAEPHVIAVPSGIAGIVASVREVTESEIQLTMFTPLGLYCSSEDAVLPKYLRSEHDSWTQHENLEELEPQTGLAVAYGPFVHIQRLSVQIAQRYGSAVRRVQYNSKTQPDRSYLEIINTRASKGAALAYICKMMNIPRKESAAIGDFANDVEMLQYAAVSGVMTNAMDELKSYGDYVTERDNDSGGVAGFFNLILNEKRKR